MNSAPARISILRQGPYLIASIHTALDDAELARFQHDLLRTITQHGIRGVIIDVGALDVLDSLGTQTLVDIGDTARLLGAATVLIGIRPDIAYAIMLLGINTGSLTTALDLDDGLAHLDWLANNSPASHPGRP